MRDRNCSRSCVIGTRNSDATALHQRSMSFAGSTPIVASDTADSPKSRCASSCASVKIWAALLSAPLIKTRGASGSARAKPRNSSGFSFRRVLLPTTPLTITRTPASSADSDNNENAALQLEPRSPTANPNASRMYATAWSVGVDAVRLPTNATRSSPSASAKSRYQSCLCSHWKIVSRRSALGRGIGALPMVRKSGIGNGSSGGCGSNKKPIGVCVAAANLPS